MSEQEGMPKIGWIGHDCAACLAREQAGATPSKAERNNAVLVNALWKACGDDEDAVNAYIESEGGLL